MDRVLGFEAVAVSDWSIIQSGPGSLAVSSTASQGARSLAVNSHGYVPAQSVALSTLGARVGSVIKYDIMLPMELGQVSPYWFGVTQLYIEIPSLGLYNAFVGQVELTPMPLGQWNTVTMTPATDVLNKLQGNYTDLRVTIVVNAPTNNTNPYLIDNLRFSDTGPGNSGPTIIALPFPNGVSRDSVAVAANGALRLNDRTTVKWLDGSWASVSNAGDPETNIGADAAAGAVTSIASVTLRERAQISGDLKTGGTLTRLNGTIVTGAIVEHATLTPASVFSWAVQLPTSNSGDVLLQPDTSKDVDPGSYGQVLVNARARLGLKTGVYTLTSLGIEPEAELALDKSGGPIIVYVTGTVAFKGKIVDSGGPEGNFLLVCLGGSDVFIERSFTGTIVVPSAKLTLASSSSGHRGTFFAKNIEIHQDNNIVAVPFGWTRLFDGQGKPRRLPADPVNPPRIPVGPFGTKLTPAAAPRVTPPTVYSGGTELGVGASGAGSPVPVPRPLGITSPGYVDNITWGYVHEAFDYVTPTGAFVSERPGRLVGLTLRRYYKPRFAAMVSSFGVGMFSNFDSKLRIVGDATNGFRILSFQMDNDLGEVQWVETDADAGDSQIDGIFHNTAGLGPSLKLLAVNGSPTPDPALATTAVLTDWNGNRQVFEIIDTVPNERSARLLQLVDANDNAVTLSYKYPAGAGQGDPSKLWQIAWVADNYGLAGTFDYAASPVNGRWVVSAFHAPNGSTITYTYDAGQVVDGLVGPALKTVVEPDGAVSTFSTEVEAATNLVVVHINDRAAAAGLMVKDVYLSQSQMRTASGSTVAQQRNLLRQIINGAGEVAYASWDDGSQPGMTYVYEGGGTLLRIELRDGNIPVSFARANFYDPTLPPSQAVFDTVETYKTDGRGQVTSKTDVAGRMTSWVRDLASGLVNAVQMPDGSIQSRVYGALSRLTGLVDRDGQANSYTYDLKGNLQAAVAAIGLPESASTSFQVNSRGQTTRATDARGNATDYTYDSRGFLTSIVEPADVVGGQRATTTFAYDSAGRMILGTDPDGRETHFEYDACNRLVTTSFADASTQVVIYGTGASAGLVGTGKDRNGNVTTMSYDGATRLVQTNEGVGTASAVSSHRTYLPGTLNLSTETTRGDRTSYGYDSKGRVVSTAAQATAGQSLTKLRFFDALGRLVSTSDPYGRRTFFLYDSDSRVTRRLVELVPGSVTGGDVESLVRIPGANPPYAIDDHSYAPTGQELESVDAVGTTIHNEYDGRGRIVKKVEGYGTASPATWEYTYDPVGNLIGVKRPRYLVEEGIEATEKNTYTGRNLLASTVLAEGDSAETRARFTYTLTRKKASTIDPRGALTQYRYATCCDRLASVVDPSGATTSYVYDKNGNLISTTDGNGNVITNTYDALNRPASRTNGEGESTTFAYDDNLTDGQGLDAQLNLSGLGFGTGADGSAAVQIDPLGGKRYSVRDGAGRLVFEQDENGNVSRAAYDTVVAGLVETRHTDALGNVGKIRSDGLGSSRQVIDPAGGVNLSEFDAMGRLLAKYDPTGAGGSCSLDPFGRPAQCADTAGDQKSYEYDTEGNTVSSLDGFGRSTTCVFDSLNRKESCVDRLGHQRSYAYDAASNRVAVSDAEANVTSYSYDSRGLVIAEHYPDSSTVSRQYDAGRRLVSETTADGLSTQMTYDRANRLISRQPSGGLADTFTYDRASRLTQGVSGRHQNTVNRSYDAGGRLLSESLVVEGVTRTVTSQYDQANRRTAIVYPDGGTLTLAYNARGLVSTVTSGGTTLASYTYDGAGKVTQNLLGNGKREVHSYRNDSLVGGVTIDGISSLSFEYDANKRLKTEKRDGQVYDGFVFDAEERLVSWSFSGPTQTWELSPEGDFRSIRSGGTVLESREHDAVHAVTSINETPLTYDTRGNLTKDRQASYSWDSDNKLASVTLDGGDTADYAYDAFGRRVSRKVGTATTVYVSDGQQVLAEYENGTLARKIIPGQVIDQPIAMTSGGAMYYFARQLNGSVHALMSDTGAVVERYDYTPHGWRTILAPDGSVRSVSAVGNAYGYTGRPHEDIGNIVDFRARQFSPDLGRFISRDDAYYDGLSLYSAYFPPDRTDPSGHGLISWVKDKVKDGGELLQEGGEVVKDTGEAAVDTVGSGVKGAVGIGKTAIGTAVDLGKGAYDLGASGVSATVDGAEWLAGKGVSYAEQLGGAGWKLTEYVAGGGYELGVWMKDQTVNVATGFGYEVYGLGRAGLAHGVDLAKAAGSFGYWVVTEGHNPFAIMSDPEGWLKRGASKAWDVHTTGFWGATWAATELAPMGGNPFGGLTVVGLAFGLGGWAAGGDAPTLYWAGGGIVFEFGNSPCTLGNEGLTLGRTILYEGTPDETLRNHEFQHVKQYAALGDVAYVGLHLASQGLSCLISGDYASANLLEAGPYGEEGAFGGEQRPWPWPGGPKGVPYPAKRCSNKHPLKGQ